MHIVIPEEPVERPVHSDSPAVFTGGLVGLVTGVDHRRRPSGCWSNEAFAAAAIPAVVADERELAAPGIGLIEISQRSARRPVRKTARPAGCPRLQ